jgi:peroxiredoxin
VSDDVLEKYLGYGIDLEEYSGRDHHVLPVPSTFIIGRDGVIKFAYSNPDYSVRISPQVLVTAAEVHRGDNDERLRKAYDARKKANEAEQSE